MKIGFFDSGLGGLLVMKSVVKMLPEYDYEFYGDTVNLPYGNKSESEIFELTKRGVEHLFARDCILVIIACNTASAETLRKLQDEFLPQLNTNKRILGVIIPTVEEVVESKIRKVLVVATKRTIESKKYEKEFSKASTIVKITSVATPALVPLIELGELDAAFTELKTTIEANGEVEGVILGCTHYSLLAERLTKSLVLKNIKIFTQDKIIPKKLQHYLEMHPEIKNLLSKDGGRNIFLTDNSSRYDSLLQEFLGGALIGD